MNGATQVTNMEMESKPTPILRLKHSHIRCYHQSDIDSLVDVANDPEVSKYLRRIFPSPYTQKDAEWWINHVSTGCGKEPPTITPETTELQFTLAHPESNLVMGGIGLHRQSDVHNRCWELGYWLGKNYWNQGVTTEATQALVDWAFHTMGDEMCQRIFIEVFDQNRASVAVAKKAGFVYEGRLRCAAHKEGLGTMDVLSYSMIRSDLDSATKSHQDA
jgi:RimJ/RimL family protein N-acetyltransferase